MTNSRKSDTENDTVEQGVERLEDAEKNITESQDENPLTEELSADTSPEDTADNATDAVLDEEIAPEGDEIIDAELEKIAEEEIVSDDMEMKEVAQDDTEATDDADIDDGENVFRDETIDEEVLADELDVENAAVDDTDPDVLSDEAEQQDVDQTDAEIDTTEMEEKDGLEESSVPEDVLAAQVQEDQTQDDIVAEEHRVEAAEEKPQLQPEPKVEVVQGSMWPGIFGGVVAALVGFIVGRGDVIDTYLPAALQRAEATFDSSALEAETAALSSQAEDLAAQAVALSGQTAGLAAQTEALTAQTESQGARLDALEVAIGSENSDALDGIATELALLSDRISALENQPIELPEELANAASTADVDALQSALDAQKSQIENLAERAAAAEASAAGEAARLLAQAALMRVMTAVDSGAAFSPVLAELEDVTPVEVPEALQTAAETGVPTLSDLQASFPEAARAGLAAARAEVPESDVTSIGGFLKRQLNVRSVTPREGTDPDAILSRAQAAIDTGDLGAALSQTEALPDAAKTAMNNWLEAASARKAAQDAAQELADSLNSN